MHGGVEKEDLKSENINALKKGLPNLDRHIENIKKFPTIISSLRSNILLKKLTKRLSLNQPHTGTRVTILIKIVTKSRDTYNFQKK